MSEPTPADDVEVPIEYTTPEGLRTLANYLRSPNGVTVRSGIQREKRVDYFKGKLFAFVCYIIHKSLDFHVIFALLLSSNQLFFSS